MYIIYDAFFQAPKREIPNLDEADSRSFAELDRLIDEKCRMFMYYFLTPLEVADLELYLVNGVFTENLTGVPQKWINLINGTTYVSNGVSLVWNGLAYSKGSTLNSLLADYVYAIWLDSQASYMTGVGDAKANPKGAFLVNPTQRIVSVWNDFVKQYQGESLGCYQSELKVSLLQFLSDNPIDYLSTNRKMFEVKNQLGI